MAMSNIEKKMTGLRNLATWILKAVPLGVDLVRPMLRLLRMISRI